MKSPTTGAVSDHPAQAKDAPPRRAMVRPRLMSSNTSMSEGERASFFSIS